MTTPTKTIKAWLIFRASDQSMRILKRKPYDSQPRALAWDEIAFDLKLTVPEPWGRLAGAITVDLPETGPAVIEISGTGVTVGADG